MSTTWHKHEDFIKLVAILPLIASYKAQQHQNNSPEGLCHASYYVCPEHTILDYVTPSNQHLSNYSCHYYKSH